MELEDRDQEAAQDPDDVRDDRQERKDEEARQQPRDDEKLHGAHPDRPQRIDLLRHHHRAELSRNAGPHPAPDEQRRHHGRGLPDDRAGYGRPDVQGRAKALELVCPLQRDHHAREEPGDHGQEERAHTHTLDLCHHEVARVGWDQALPDRLGGQQGDLPD